MFKAESNCQTSPKLAQDTPAHEPNKRTCWRMSRIHISWKKLQFAMHGKNLGKFIQRNTCYSLLVPDLHASELQTPQNTCGESLPFSGFNLISKELIKFFKYSQGQVYNKLYVFIYFRAPVLTSSTDVGLRGFLTHPFGSTNCIHQAEFTGRKIYPPQAHGLGPLLGDISLRAAPFITSATTWGVAAGEKALFCGFFKYEKKVCKPGKWRWCVYKYMMYNIQYIHSWWCI